MDASTAIFEDIVRRLMKGKKITAEQLAATGMDIEVLSSATRLLLPHIMHLRGFKPFSEHYPSPDSPLTKGGLSVNKHLLLIRQFIVRFQLAEDGSYESTEIAAYLTREGKWYVVFRLLGPDQTGTEPQSSTWSLHDPANPDTLRQLVDYIQGCAPTSGRFERPGGFFGTINYSLESIALSLAEGLLREFGRSIDQKQSELNAEVAARTEIQKLLDRFDTPDGGFSRARR